MFGFKKLIAGGLAAVLFFAAEPALQMSQAADTRTPVVLIPGTTRSRLEDADGKLAWGNWSSFFRFKKDGFLEIELTSTDPTQNHDGLRPAGILKKIPLIPKLLHLDSYKTFLKKMEEDGYVIGDIRQPRRGDNFFIFDYDWRLDHVRNAEKLSARIDELKVFFDNPQQKFNVIAHSSGSYIARYYMLYGGKDVLDREPFAPDYKGADNIEKLFLIAPLHKGTMLAFQILNEGYVPIRHFPIVFKYPADSAFSAPAFFQLLPPESEVFFVSHDGREIQVNPYDPANWVKYKWSVFSDEQQKQLEKRMKKEHGQEWQAALEERNAFLRKYLSNVLVRAEAFHRSLEGPIEIPEAMEMTLFIARYGDTLARAEFSPNPGELDFRSGATREQRVEEGDGIVTLESMMGSYSDAHMPDYVFIHAKHSRIASNRELQGELLKRLSA